MSKLLQLRGGTTAEHATFTGALREVTVDTTKDTLVIHDGATVGGFPLPRTKADIDALNINADLLDGQHGAYYAPIDAPALTGNPTAVTQTAGDNSTRIATTAYADTAVSNLVAAAPATLDTLNELAAALGDDPNFATTVTNSIATKLPLAGGTMTGNVNLGDNVKAVFGAGSDLQIYHDGTHSIIKESGAGDLLIYGNNLRLGNADGSELYILGNNNAEVQLRYDNATKIATTATGIDVTGVITTDGMTTSADINFGDSDKAIFGAGTDLQIFHDGTHSYIQSTTGDLKLTTAGGTEFALTAVNNGAVTLYHDGGAKLATNSGGITVTGTVAATSYTGDGSALTGVGASTTFGAVGTYCQCIALTTDTLYLRNTTIAGTSLQPGNVSAAGFDRYAGKTVYGQGDEIRIGGGTNQSALSGTWRFMGETQQDAYLSCDYPLGLYVRIS